MARNDNSQAFNLIERMARLLASDAWAEGLNPTQAAALQYLARANRFSRSPSQVAEYLSATRGTVSQTLKALQQKNLITEQRSASDKRRISYDLTTKGLGIVNGSLQPDASKFPLAKPDAIALNRALSTAMRGWLSARQVRPFGFCKDCQYHEKNGATLRCTLLDVDLRPAEAEKICFEQQPIS